MTYDPRAFVDFGLPNTLALQVYDYDKLGRSKGDEETSDTYIAIGLDIPFLEPNEAASVFTYYTKFAAGPLT
eukprot:2123306-Prorocentrum_lima.AAC.1